MKNKLSRGRSHWDLVLLIAILVSVISIAWTAFNNRFMINPDGISYISIARHYESLDIGHAVNAYWSPFLSWLMVPFIHLGISGTLAFIVINFFAACLVLLFGLLILKRTHKTKQRRWLPVVYVTLITPFLIKTQTGPITPDLLVVAWCIVCTNLFINIGNSVKAMASSDKKINLNPLKKKSIITPWALMGIVGGVGYLIKLYILPVFLVAFLIYVGVLILHLRKIDRTKLMVRRLAVLASLTFMVFITLSIPWVLTLYSKYNKVTIGSVYTYNMSIGSNEHPMSVMPLPPPHEKAVFSWEDPTDHVKYMEDIHDSNRDGLRRSRIERMWGTIPDYVTSLTKIWVFVVPVLVAGVILSLLGIVRKRGEFDSATVNLLSVTVVAVVYTAGYLAIGNAGTARYQWPIIALAMIIFILLVSFLPEKFMITNKSMYGLLSFITVFLVCVLTFAQMNVRGSLSRKGSPPKLLKISRLIHSRNILSSDARIMSNNLAGGAYLSYYSNWRSYGVSNDAMLADQQLLNMAISKYDINALITFNNSETPQLDLPIIYEDWVSRRYCKSETEGCRLKIYDTTQG